jgi:voltage-dependent calcium channel L type alpha-1D
LRFDNLAISVFNIFQIITLEGWTDMMYTVRQATNTYFHDFLFFAIVIFGAYFVLNLVIAVQFTHLGLAFDDENHQKKVLK